MISFACRLVETSSWDKKSVQELAELAELACLGRGSLDAVVIVVIVVGRNEEEESEVQSLTKSLAEGSSGGMEVWTSVVEVIE